MENKGGISIKPVDKDNWVDFEAFFQSQGKLNYCWCMCWRLSKGEKDELKQNDSACRKAFIKRRVWENTPVGILGYAQKEAVAWCSIAPRETHRPLGGDGGIKNVWSITCFYIKNGYRRQGLMKTLIEGAKNYAAQNGTHYIEAYPVEKDSPSYRFMGFIKTFEEAGFSFVKTAGKRRHVMVHKMSALSGGAAI
ncbi:MAG: GNAT family N-acetyltransferase [Spirochaetaceae bacterium]|nr:GNAT family N-acetyltransferase [Spirochaetaceae bacterium]